MILPGPQSLVCESQGLVLILLRLRLALTPPTLRLFHFDAVDVAVVGLRALVQLLDLSEVRELVVEGRAGAAAAAGAVGGGLLGGPLGGLVDIELLILEELDDGELGQVELGRQRVDSFLVWVQPHILDETLQDAQGLQGDLAPSGAGLGAGPATLVLGLGRRACGGLPWGKTGPRGLLLLEGRLGQDGLRGELKGQGRLVLGLGRGLQIKRDNF